MKYLITEEKIIEAASKCKSASEAAAFLGVCHETYKKYARSLGVYKSSIPNFSKSPSKKDGYGKIPLSEILEGKHPQYQANKLKIRLIETGIKFKMCEICKLTKWNNVDISLECHHINGNSSDHRLSNLQLLCPNCHAQTNTYRGKNSSVIKIKKENQTEKLIQKQKESENKKNLELIIKQKQRENIEIENNTKIFKKHQSNIEKVKNSNIDFTKFGWVQKVSKLINKKHQKVSKWMKTYCPEIYEKCFKKKFKVA